MLKPQNKKVKYESQSVMPDSVTPCSAACQAPLSMEFPRQESWSRLPCPPPGDLPTLRIKPKSPTLAGRLFNHCTTRDSHESSYKLVTGGREHVIQNSQMNPDSHPPRPECKDRQNFPEI